MADNARPGRVHTLWAVAIAAMLSGCGGGGGSSERRVTTPDTPAPPAAPVATVAATSPHVPGAPYASALRDCTYAGDATQACTLERLPFLGMESTNPTINDILARTLVSHPWMGANFEQVLAELPADVLPLFRSVTAVVIASDVRPARYVRNTGAIYLDPDFLWLSVDERNTVSTQPDPRSGFGLDLDFEMPWRYVRNNQRLTVFLNADGSRDLDQIIEIMGYLLYHELAHAVDFMPPERMGALGTNLTVRQALDQHPPLSSSFISERPLDSGLLKQLAEVSFLGADSTPAQRNLEPDDLVDEFANDGAVQYYAYTTQFEDFAVLFETAMMKWHFGYDKDTAITHRPASGNSNDAVVTWGTRGRLGEMAVNGRALGAGQRIYPGAMAEFEAFLASEPTAPPRMRPGDTWGQNLVLGPTQPAGAPAQAPGIDRSGRRADYFLERVRIR